MIYESFVTQSFSLCGPCVLFSSSLCKGKGEFLYSAVSNPQDYSKRFTLYSLADLFNQTPSRLLWEASSYMLQLMCKDCLYTYPPLSVAMYSFIQLRELKQCRVKKLAQSFNTAAQVLNLGPFSRESEALPLNQILCIYCVCFL